MQVEAPVRPPEEKAKDDDVEDVDEPSWSKHDLGFALQLRSLREGIVRRTLRKLHIRYQMVPRLVQKNDDVVGSSWSEERCYSVGSADS